MSRVQEFFAFLIVISVFALGYYSCLGGIIPVSDKDKAIFCAAPSIGLGE